jgi:hypothetical protein
VAAAPRSWLLGTNRSSAVTVRQTAGLSAKGQPTDVDAGLPELVQLNILDRTGVVACSCGNAVPSDGDSDGDESGASFSCCA